MKKINFNIKIFATLGLSFIATLILSHTIFSPFDPKIRRDWPQKFMASITNFFKEKSGPSQIASQKQQYIPPPAPIYAREDAGALIGKQYDTNKHETKYTYNLKGKVIIITVPDYLQKPSDGFVSKLQ